jgi:hypothetical protein
MPALYLLFLTRPSARPRFPPLRYNLLSGHLPERLGHSPKFLLLGFNAFSGSIPASWGNTMRNLEILGLQ